MIYIINAHLPCKEEVVSYSFLDPVKPYCEVEGIHNAVEIMQFGGLQRALYI